jgi:hypothetical protein
MKRVKIRNIKLIQIDEKTHILLKSYCAKRNLLIKEVANKILMDALKAE